jgi:hypothetical protein
MFLDRHGTCDWWWKWRDKKHEFCCIVYTKSASRHGFLFQHGWPRDVYHVGYYHSCLPPTTSSPVRVVMLAETLLAMAGAVHVLTAPFAVASFPILLLLDNVPTFHTRVGHDDDYHGDDSSKMLLMACIAHRSLLIYQ